MHFEIKSDRNVLVDGIGELVANEPRVLTADELRFFQVYHGVRLADANFASHVSVTAVVELESTAELEGGN